MNREEAIAILEFKLGRGEKADHFRLNNTGVSRWIGNLSDEREALEMAISALSAEGEYIKKEDAYNCFIKWRPYMATRMDKYEKEMLELPTYSFPDREKGEQLYSDLLRVKHGTMNIDSLIDKVYADMRGE